jgi:hypothetical protein
MTYIMEAFFHHIHGRYDSIDGLWRISSTILMPTCSMLEGWHARSAVRLLADVRCLQLSAEQLPSCLIGRRQLHAA